jgi:hypothetical protein
MTHRPAERATVGTLQTARVARMAPDRTMARRRRTAAVCLADAGGAGGGSNDQPFSCTPNDPVPGGDPPYVLGGARPAFLGGVITPGLYRATKATNYYVEDAPGDCNGKTPPTATTYAGEMDIRPTHYLLRSAGITIAGSWTSCGNEFVATLECPNVKPAAGFGYTATANTFIRDSKKTNYTSGGCRFGLVYEFTKQ